jgi:hypothetical protein
MAVITPLGQSPASVPCNCRENVGLRIFFGKPNATATSVHLRRSHCRVCGGEIWIVTHLDGDEYRARP